MNGCLTRKITMKNILLILRSLLVAMAAIALCATLQAQQEKAALAGDGAADLSGATKTTATPAKFGERNPRYKIAPGDVFDVNFELSPEFNQTVTVQPDGFISLRGIGDVHVTGDTVPELTESLRQSYSKILSEPLISVLLKDFEKPYFVADGQVGKPGKYE